MSDVLIAIILRDNLALSKTAIKSALAQQPSCDVLCVNNASSDGSAAYINAKQVAVISFEKQVSLSACWNAALKAAWRLKYKAVILCNNDILLREDCASLLYEYDSGFVSCVSVSSEEQLGIAGDRTIEDLRKSERDHPDFSCFAIRKSVTDKVGFFNEEYYPGYVEDAEFHARAWRVGVRLLCVDLPFVHFGASTLKQATEREAIIIRRGADTNRERFRKKYGCLPGTPEYDKLFLPEMFGSDDLTKRQCVACGSRAHATSLCPVNNAAMSPSSSATATTAPPAP